MQSSQRAAFDERCTRAADVARAAGATIAKVPKAHAIAVSGNGIQTTFPIVTDERDWRDTTPDEAFYSVLLDAHAWASAHPDDATIATLDDVERSEVALIRKDLAEESGRLRSLESLLGGRDALVRVLAAAGLDPATLPHA